MNLFDVKRDPSKEVLQTPSGVDPLSKLPDYDWAVDGFSPSDEQRRVFGTVQQGSGDIIVEAVAGSGKTETLLGCARIIDDAKSCLICAFNKSVEEELTQRIDKPGVRVDTFHSHGKRALKSEIDTSGVFREKSKRFNVVNKILREREEADDNQLRSDLLDLTELAQQTLVDTGSSDEMAKMAFNYGYHWEERYAPMVQDVIKEMSRMAIESGTVGFEDMIYVPVQNGYINRAYDWVLVDEAQDLNNAQQKLALQACKPSGRRLYVGDRKQAINGFQGADPGSIDNIKEETGAVELDLTVCFRCPKSHIAEAQEIVPKIKPAPWAKKGTLERKPLRKLPNLVEAATEDSGREDPDLVLCRMNEPLIEWCLETALKTAKPAYVEKRDLKGSLEQIVEIADEKTEGTSQEAFEEGLSQCKDNAEEIASNLKKADADEVIRQAGAIKKIVNHKGWEGKTSLKDTIEILFEETEEAIRFTTIHKAKGQENKRVFIIKPNLKIENDTDWQEEQEENLNYVMKTRSKEALILLNEGIQDEGGKIETTSSKEGYMRLYKEDVAEGNMFEHKEYGTGRVVTLNKVDGQKMVMYFEDLDSEFREVRLDNPVFKGV
jgi:DNA helicase-2/ATP-dependent DNA helicase PcrA